MAHPDEDVVREDRHAVVLFTTRAERAGRARDDRTVRVTHLRRAAVSQQAGP